MKKLAGGNLGNAEVRLNEGQLIKAPFFDGVGEVKKFQKKTGYVLLEASYPSGRAT